MEAYQYKIMRAVIQRVSKEPCHGRWCGHSGEIQTAV